MFKLEKRPQQKESRIGNRRGSSSLQIAQSVNLIIEDMFNPPLMIAYSSLINDDVRQKAKAAGFNAAIESPLTVQKI